MQYKIRKTDRQLMGLIKLPSSKSISNRALILNALSHSSYPVENLSDSDDTKVMNEVLTSNGNHFDIHHAGTAMRFLTAFLSKIVGEWHITGSTRMQERPIGILVEALRQMGANITYEGKEGYPPLKIQGANLQGGVIELDGSVSSQFISALLMIGPTLNGGLTLRLKNQVMSRSYIELTLRLMEKFGAQSTFEGNEIRIEEQAYTPIQFHAESDWSGASYIYELAALCDDVDVELPYLNKVSLQGDSAIAKWFEEFGVDTQETANGLRLIKTEDKKPARLDLDFILTPDVAQTLVVVCAMKKVPFHFTGLETLKIKETDRIAALIAECAKFGVHIVEPKHGELSWDGVVDVSSVQEEIVFETYRDHRMAMAFAPVAMFHEHVSVKEPMVVTKSYPAFWEDIKFAGFTVES